MPLRRFPLPYRNNPQLLRQQGFRTQDEQTGFWTYSDLIVTDDYGTQVDGTGNGFDWDKTEGQGVGLSSVDIQGGSVFLTNGGRDTPASEGGTGGGTNPDASMVVLYASNQGFVITCDDIASSFTGPNITFSVPAQTYTAFTFQWAGDWSYTYPILGVPIQLELSPPASIEGVASSQVVTGDGHFDPSFSPSSPSTNASILALINAAAGGVLTLRTIIDFFSAVYTGNTAQFTTTNLTLTLYYNA